jgi:hypothetical protein
MKDNNYFNQAKTVGNVNLTLDFPYKSSIGYLSLYLVYQSFENRYSLNKKQKKNFLCLSKDKLLKLKNHNFSYYKSFVSFNLKKKAFPFLLKKKKYKLKKLRFLSVGKKLLFYSFQGFVCDKYIGSKNKSKIFYKKEILLHYKKIGKLTYSL